MLLNTYSVTYYTSVGLLSFAGGFACSKLGYKGGSLGLNRFDACNETPIHLNFGRCVEPFGLRLNAQLKQMLDSILRSEDELFVTHLS